MKKVLLTYRILLCLISMGMLLACAFPKNTVQMQTEANTDGAQLSAEGNVPESEEQSRNFTFSTTDVYENAIDDSIFDQYDLIMLNFWAYWCQPCVREIPELEQLHQSYPNVLLLGVIVDDTDMDATLSILENANVSYPVVFPAGDLEKLARNCQYIPTTFFLKPNGLILGEPQVGSNDLDGWTKIVEGNLK